MQSNSQERLGAVSAEAPPSDSFKGNSPILKKAFKAKNVDN